MKKLLYLVLLLSNYFGYAQYTLIPDSNFEKALINLGIDIGAIDGKVLTTNVIGITSLDIAAQDITNLTGLQDFVSLTVLECSRNKLASLDVTKNTALYNLNCWGNNLTSLDVSKNTSLSYLSCFQNQLISLDVSKNTVLSQLYCSWNKLTNLNLKNGNNNILFALNAFSNPNLNCIQVDNKPYSETNWPSSYKDAVASYSENCSKTAATTTPPVIIATGDQIYCPSSSIKIVTTVTITHDPLELGTNSVTIQISSGYVFGQDKLDLTGFHPTITSSWSSSEGKLTLKSPTGIPVTYADFETAIKDVIYTNSSTSPSGTRDFSINLGIGSANYLPRNGHFYEYVPSIGITWTTAQAAASTKNYYGLQGYLATLTAADEAQLAGAQAPGAGWIGGSDAQTEGVWKWVTGPEGLANGGTGTPFWNGLANGFTTFPDNFALWNTGEPNQAGDEDYAHITAPGVGKPGSWNDLSNTGELSGNYQPKGYIVEYGGMPGELPLEISASTKITIPKIETTTPATRCGTGSVTLQASVSNGTVNWYDLATSGTLLFTGTSFTTPTITNTTSYYVDASNVGCSRTEVIATIKTIPTIATTSPASTCGPGIVTLGATASAGTINWYTTLTGGTSIGTGTSFSTPLLSSTTSYYVDTTDNGCTTGIRTKIDATVYTIPTIITTAPASTCGPGKVTLGVTASSGIINWYTSLTGGISVATGESFTTPLLSSTTSYYVEATDSGCTTGIRTKIDATVNTIPTITTTTPVSICGSRTVTLFAAASAGTINWYTSLTGGISVGTGISYTTPLISITTSYYVDATDNGCTTSIRTKIDATIKTIPTITTTAPASNCGSGTVTLGATASAGTINWYTSLTGGISVGTGILYTTPLISSTTSYYVDATDNGCTTGIRTKIDATIKTIPTITATIPASTCGSGTVTLGATTSAGVINWHTSLTGGISIGTGTSFTTPLLSNTTSYYVDATDNGCTTGIRTKIIATVNPLPTVNDITITQCDTDLISDGKTLFNLTVNNDVISANYNNEIFAYYTTLNGANNAILADLIPNELAFQNTTPTLMGIWSRISNKITGCFSVAKLTLKVPATNINPNTKIPFPPVCDDFFDTNGNNTANNNNRDGITTFNFSSTKAIIQALLPSTDVYKINYYKNESDALAEIDVITDISNYRNIGYPNSQDIWVRIDSDLDNACYGLGPYLTLNVEALPVANTVSIPRQCDDNNDGIFTFNTSLLESYLLKGQLNKTVTYFDQTNAPLRDANRALITSPFPNTFASTSQTIKAVVTNNTVQKCFDETFITLIVDQSPSVFAVSSSFTTACDDESNPLNQDGKFAFNTSTFETTILGGQTGMIVKYYDSNNILLPSPLPNPFVTKTQNITVTVENSSNKICSASTTLNFVVNPIPNLDLNLDGKANKLVCSNLPTFFVTLDAGITDNTPTSDYNYIWKKDAINLNTNSPTLGVNSEGVYTVEVTNNSGCSRIRTIGVKASNVATIDSIDIVDLSDVNSVTVNVSGPGDYEYSLDDHNNFWQDSNFFDNIPAGIHEVFINDKNGCGLVSKEIVVVGIPKYFTPNNDSYNDEWGIKGLSKYPAAIVQVFDRYGKLITTLNPINPTWDGLLNGSPLPADDYWYAITLEKNKPTIRGHFSLKR